MSKNWEDKVKESQKIAKEGIDNTQIKKTLIKVLENRSSEDDADLLYWKIFKREAEKNAKAEGNRFRFKYIDYLNLDWNILILLGKKNIGKTYELTKLINKTVKEGNWFVYIRALAGEAMTAVKPQFEEDNSDIRLQGRGQGHFDFVHKDLTDPETGKPLKVGFYASISSLNKYQGASYPKVKLIIWDECVNDNSNVKINSSHMIAFDRFISSIVRDKKGVKVILSGNLLGKTSDMYGDPVLNHYGLATELNLKYIPGKDRARANILYLNTGNLFKGIEEQGVLGGVNELKNIELLENKIPSKGIKTLDEYDYLNASPLYALCFTYNAIKKVVYISQLGESLYWIIKMEIFNEQSIYDFKKNMIYTDEEPLANEYEHALTLVDAKDWASCWENLIEMFAAGRIYYNSQETGHEITQIVKHYKPIVERENKQSQTRKKFF